MIFLVFNSKVGIVPQYNAQIYTHHPGYIKVAFSAEYLPIVSLQVREKE